MTPIKFTRKELELIKEALTTQYYTDVELVTELKRKEVHKIRVKLTKMLWDLRNTEEERSGKAAQ